MHVLYIHQHFATPDDSIGTRSYELAQRLINAGHQVTMLCGNTEREHATGTGTVLETIDSIAVVRIMVPYRNDMSFMMRVLSFLRFTLGAARAARNINADLVFASSTPLTVAVPGVLGARRHNVPFVLEIRDLWPELPIAMGVIRNPLIISALRHLEHWAYKNAKAIVTLAPGMRDGVVATGLARGEVDIIPNAADLNLFKPATRTTDPRFGDENTLRAVYCGHHGRANGLEALAHAADFLKSHKSDLKVRFVMIGTGSEKPALVKHVKQNGLDDYFVWIDPMPKRELAQLLPRMDVGLMLLRNVEAFRQGTSPNKFFDYLAAGLPVLTNYPGWVSETISQNNSGINVLPDDPAEFANGLEKMHALLPQRRVMGDASRALAQRDYSRDKLGERFVSFLENAAS
jgi:glycosyltransferase involved in cell wall biosynthesis